MSYLFISKTPDSLLPLFNDPGQLSFSQLFSRLVKLGTEADELSPFVERFSSIRHRKIMNRSLGYEDDGFLLFNDNHPILIEPATPCTFKMRRTLTTQELSSHRSHRITSFRPFRDNVLRLVYQYLPNYQQVRVRFILDVNMEESLKEIPNRQSYSYATVLTPNGHFRCLVLDEFFSFSVSAFILHFRDLHSTTHRMNSLGFSYYPAKPYPFPRPNDIAFLPTVTPTTFL